MPACCLPRAIGPPALGSHFGTACVCFRALTGPQSVPSPRARVLGPPRAEGRAPRRHHGARAAGNQPLPRAPPRATPHIEQLYKRPDDRSRRLGMPRSHRVPACGRGRPADAPGGRAGASGERATPHSADEKPRACTGARSATAAAAAAAVVAQPTRPHLFPTQQPDSDMDFYVRVADGQFVVGPTCKRFLVTGWNQLGACRCSCRRSIGARAPARQQCCRRRAGSCSTASLWPCCVAS